MATSGLNVDPKTLANDIKMSKLGLRLYSWGGKNACVMRKRKKNYKVNEMKTILKATRLLLASHPAHRPSLPENSTQSSGSRSKASRGHRRHSPFKQLSV